MIEVLIKLHSSCGIYSGCGYMDNMKKDKKKYNHNKDDVYSLFYITDDKRLLFYKMEKEWSVIPKKQNIKPYDIYPINTNMKGGYDA